MSDIKWSVSIGTVKIRNPTLLASGVLGQTGANMKRVLKGGAGGVVTKSVGPRPKKGYAGPTVVQTPCGLINAMGLPNPGIDDMIREIKIVKETGGAVIGSIFGGKVEEFEKQSQRMSEAGADAIELNLSCPHAENLSTIGHDPDMAEDITKKVSKKADIPVWVKLPCNTNISRILKVARKVEKAGGDAITVTNTIPAMAIDAESKKPILGNKVGGLSGPAIKPVGLRLVYEIYRVVDIPIIGVGGVTSGKDMVEYMLAGASAVQIGTGIMWRGWNIFEKVCEEATAYLEDRELVNLIGSAH